MCHICECCGSPKVKKLKKEYVFEYMSAENKTQVLSCYMPVYLCPDCNFEYYGEGGEKAISETVQKFKNSMESHKGT